MNGMSSAPQDWMSPEIVEVVKSATVFLKVDTGFRSRTGSAFVLKRDGNLIHLVTNEHVIRAAEPAAALFEAVFFSGTPLERRVRAEIAGSDPYRDLAILKAEMENPPSPLELVSSGDLRELLPVFIFGFPFGRSLSMTDANPSVTITKGHISKILPNEYGEPARIQIDGHINRGNSGGPVVDSQGRVVGIATESVKKAGIGLAIPVTEIREMLAGRVLNTRMMPLETGAEFSDVFVCAEVGAPLGSFREVSVLLTPWERVISFPSPDDKGLWPALPNAREYALAIRGRYAVRGIRFDRKHLARELVFLLQIRYVRADGQVRFTQPGDFRVHFSN